jgi:phage tail-like protein
MPTPPDAQRFDPYKSFKFRVTWSGKVVLGANKASGLPLSPHTAAQPAAAVPPPIRTKYEPITLESGVTYDSTFQNWANKIDNSRQNLVLESFDEASKKLLTWNLQGCWVSEFKSLPDLGAGANALAIQHLILQHEGLIIPKTGNP